MLPSEIPKFPTDPLVRGFPGIWKLLFFKDSLPGWVFVPNSFVSLSFIFCPISFWRQWAAFLGAWCPLPGGLLGSEVVLWNFLKWSLDEFVGEKVVSPSYSSAILGPPPRGSLFFAAQTSHCSGLSCCQAWTLKREGFRCCGAQA